MRVFLGVGHGGVDCGAIGNGHHEADINLAIALACKSELECNGVIVGISRTKDENDPLTEEIAECNAFNADLAVDVHTNAGGGDGFEVFHTYLGGMGKTLAQNIESEVKALGQNSRGIKTKLNSSGKDYFGFIRQTNCPAVICEIGFIDNKSDLSAFDEESEQIAFGKAYARGILKTLGIAVKQEEKPEMKIYNYVQDMPEWARSAATKAIKKGVIKLDKDGKASVWECNLQSLVWLDRCGQLD